MVNNIGYFLMVSALGVSAYGVLAPHLGARRNNWNLVRSAQFGAVLNFILVLGASIVLIRAFLLDDFSVAFVWENSSTDLPLAYKISAFWGGMNGSLLFWELVLAGFTALVAFLYSRTNREVLPYVLVTLNVIHVFLLILLVGWSNPLAVLSPVPLEGRGLNPLLQHPAMAMHPPMLYLGYIGFSVPFAFAMASLIRARLDNAWVITTRRWTLSAWYALTMGQMLGGLWAYEELGWGGYWGWDPVENASFMPWLTGTAFLHSVILQEKRDMMKIWNMVLIVITFGLSILGTFIVRSGVLNSVHAFAQSEVGPAFLVFLAIVLVLATVLIFQRLRLLESRHTSDSLLSREFAFLLNNLLLVLVCFVVLLGTVFPLLAEAIRGTKLSIQAPFFNTLIAPLGVGLLYLMGVGTLIAWRHSSWSYLVRNFRWPATAGLVTMVVLAALGMRHLGALILFAGSAFTTYIIFAEFGRSVRVRMHQQGKGFGDAALGTLLRNQQRWGGALVHLGVVVMIMGLAGTMFNREYNVTLTVGQPKDVGELRLLYTGTEVEKVRNATLRQAALEVYRGDELISTMKPARSFYPTQPDPLTEVANHRTVAQDIYIVLASENEDGSVTLRVLINPMVMFAWFAFPLFTLGAALAIFYSPRRLESTVFAGRLGMASGGD